MTQRMYEVTLFSGDAEACVLVAARSKREAVRVAMLRASEGSLSWEGEPSTQVFPANVQCLGRDTQ